MHSPKRPYFRGKSPSVSYLYYSVYRLPSSGQQLSNGDYLEDTRTILCCFVYVNNRTYACASSFLQLTVGLGLHSAKGCG